MVGWVDEFGERKGMSQDGGKMEREDLIICGGTATVESCSVTVT